MRVVGKHPRHMSAGAQTLLPPVVMPDRRSIHAVRPRALGMWECLASCPFVGGRDEAIGHAVSRQFDLVAR